MRLQSSITPSHLGLSPGARPARRRPHRGLSPSWDGYFASHKCLGAAPFESLLERDFQTLISADPSILAYAAQPHRLTYWMLDGRGGRAKRTYTPDYAARRRDGRILVFDVKAEYFASREEWLARERHIRQAYREDHGATFLVFTENQIRLQPRLANCQLLLRYRPATADPAGEAAVREALVHIGCSATIGEICELASRSMSVGRARAAIAQLAISGAIAIDLSTPLSEQTRVTEIGA